MVGLETIPVTYCWLTLIFWLYPKLKLIWPALDVVVPLYIVFKTVVPWLIVDKTLFLTIEDQTVVPPLICLYISVLTYSFIVALIQVKYYFIIIKYISILFLNIILLLL